MASTLTSQEVQKRIGALASRRVGEKLSVADSHSLEQALSAYATSTGGRFGASLAQLKKLGVWLCAQLGDESLQQGARAELFSRQLNKSAFVARLLAIVQSLSPRVEQEHSSSNLVLQPGELQKVRSFLTSLRSRSSPESSVDSEEVVDVTASSSGWTSLMQQAGVGTRTQEKQLSDGLSFLCPLLESRRGKYSRGPDALAADCKQQIRAVKAWASPPDVDTVRKVNELRSVLSELAQVAGPVPPMPLHEDVLRLYVHLLDVCARRCSEKAAHPPASGEKHVSFGSLSVVAPVQPGLDSVANARFTQATSRQVADNVSEGHINECVHVIEQHKVFAGAPPPKPLVPLSVRVVIQQTMAPADARVADAYSIVKGVGPQAEKKRAEVKEIMVQIFEQARSVAFERLKRGSAADREKRRKLGIQLAEDARQSSLQRESLALAELRVLARCLPVGVSAVSTLRASRSMPELAADLVRLQPSLSMSQALTLAKNMMKSQPKPAIQVSRATTPAASQPQRLVIQMAGGGRQSNGGWQQRATSDADQPPKKRSRGGKRKCHYCKSAGHVIADCPAKKAGLPRTRFKKNKEE